MADQTSTIQKGWKETALGEVAVFNYGKGLNTENRNNGNIPVYGSSGITGFHNEALINEEGYIIGRKGTVGSIHYSPVPFFPIDTVYYLTKKDIKCDFRFFYYLLHTLGLDKLNFDSAVPGLNREMAYSLTIDIPENEIEQPAIAAVLSSFDDKIELLREQNKTLEATAQAIFKRWFVEFEFPNAKGKSYKTAGGKMIDSELGKIPEGWRVGRIKDYGEIVCGKTPSKGNREYFGGEIPFIKIPDMHNQVFIITTEDSLTEVGANTQKNKFIPANSICVSCIATVGLVSITSKKSQTNQQINSMMPSSENYFEYLFLALKNMRDDLLAIGTGGSATLNINTTTFSDIEIIFPENNILEKFHHTASSTFQKINFNNSQIQTLSKLRDTLLPKLMKGEVRVKGF